MKKVLIITYYWPPAGGPGVQRVLKFVKYLPQFGWQPVILTVNDGEYPAIDKTLEKEIPADLKVYKTKAIEPFYLYKKITGTKDNIPTHVINKSSNETFKQKLMKWIRANLFIPDARVGWKPYLVKEGRRIIQSEKPDVIFSSSPPHSLQLGAEKLADEFGLKWIADFRDPWSDGFWFKDLPRTNFAIKKDNQYENKVLNRADYIISVSKSITKRLDLKVANNYGIIPNGYDEPDFTGITKQPSNKFRITYTGDLRANQIPLHFFQALTKLKEKQIEVNFVGTMHPDGIKLINELGLNSIVNIIPYQPHSEVIKYLVNSELLLLTIPNTENNEGILTGKLFEYIGSKNFILGFGPPHGDAAQILNELKSGIMLNYSEDPLPLLLSKYQLWEKGEKLNPAETNADIYTRKNLTKKLADIFEDVL